MNRLLNIAVVMSLAGIFLAGPLVVAQTKIEPDRVTAANQALQAALATGVPNLPLLRADLHTGDFKGAENTFRDAMKRYQENAAYEHYLYFGYGLITQENDIALSSLDAWVEATGSAIAYAARGIYKSELGSDSRGGETINNTPRHKLDAMASYYIEAAEDLMTAVALDSALTPAYIHLMRISMSLRLPMTKHEILSAALKHDNRTYYLRAQYMKSLLPRWGGSTEEMYVFGKQFAESADLNPRLYTFLGEINADNAHLSYLKKDYNDAAMRYSFAMKFGDRIEWLRTRGYCYFHLEEFEKAHADFMSVLKYDASDQNALSWVLQCNGQMQALAEREGM